MSAALEAKKDAAPSGESPAAAEQGRESGPTEVIGIVAFFALATVLAVRVWGAMPTGSALALALAAFLGYVAADLVSGLVHWAFDTWGSPDTPVVGKTFIVPFRVHHSDPKDITRHGFVPTNGHNCLAAVPALAAALFVPPGTWLGALAITFLVSLCLGVFLTNQAHKWAHEDEPATIVKWLQDARLVLGREHHDIHHSPPYDKHYCITTGWLNAPLVAIGFWRRLERLITAITGWQPRVDDLKDKPAAQ